MILILIISHWYVLNGKYILTLLHNNKPKDTLSDIFDKYNLSKHI